MRYKYMKTIKVNFGERVVKGVLLFYLFTFPLNISAQCGIENTAFKSGEFLSYDLTSTGSLSG